jgi:hypothetical protein
VVEHDSRTRQQRRVVDVDRLSNQQLGDEEIAPSAGITESNVE